MRRCLTIGVGLLLAMVLAATVTAAPTRANVITKALATKEGGELKDLLGEPTAREVIGLICDHNLAGSWKTLDDKKAADFAAAFLAIEVKNCKAVKAAVDAMAEKLAAGTLKAVMDTDEMAVADYGAATTDKDALKASKWINHASNTTRGNEAEITSVTAILEEATKKSKPHSYAHLSTLNKVLVVAPDQPARSIVPESPLPSSVAGARLLEMALADLSQKKLGDPGAAAGDVACYLLGAVVRCHGFVDGNGRTARAAYALALLQGGAPFKAITVAGEKKLHGLP